MTRQLHIYRVRNTNIVHLCGLQSRDRSTLIRKKRTLKKTPKKLFVKNAQAERLSQLWIKSSRCWGRTIQCWFVCFDRLSQLH